MIGYLFIAKLQDYYGRKKIYALYMFVNFLTLVGMLSLPKQKDPSLYILYGLMFCNGMAASGRQTTGYTYFTEFYPEKYQPVIGTLWATIESFTIFFLTLYFVYITKSWVPIIMYCACMNAIFLIIVICFLPESPKWLYDQG